MRSSKLRSLTLLFTIFTMLFVLVTPAFAYSIRTITFYWSSDYGGSIVMRFDATGNYNWVTSGRLTPLPEANFGAWKFGAINGWNYRYMVVGAVMGEVYRICLGVSDSDLGSGDVLYQHANNRCFKVWRTGGTNLSWKEIFNVYGRVTNSSASPISGVTISNGAGRTASTNSNGYYSFLNLESGSYALTASKSGYTFSPGSRTVSGGPPFHITGQNFTGSNLYSISGRVADGSGNPIVGVTISDGAGHTASTNSSGNYTLNSLASGAYTLTPSKSGYTFYPTSHSVSVPPSATGQDFTVTNRFSISGQVTDGSDNPIANVPVTCIGWPSRAPVQTDVTDSNGNYVFSDLTRGFYLVLKTLGSSYKLSPVVRGPFLLPPSRSGQNFTTTPIYGTVSGRVTVQGTEHPIAGARVSVGGKVGTTNGNGNYSLASVLPGTHNIYVSASGYVSYKGQVTVRANETKSRNVVLAPVRAEGYRLPYPGGNRYKCTQGNNSSFSHTGSQRYAFDFGTAYNPVVASRAGRVIAIKTNGSSCGYWSGGRFICSSTCLYSANYVRIRHPDNKRHYTD